MTIKTIKKLCVPAVYFFIFVFAFTLTTGQSYAQECLTEANEVIVAVITGPNHLKVNDQNKKGQVILHTNIPYTYVNAAIVCLSANESEVEVFRLVEDSNGRLNVHFAKDQINADEDGYNFVLVVGDNRYDPGVCDFYGECYLQAP